MTVMTHYGFSFWKLTVVYAARAGEDAYLVHFIGHPAALSVPAPIRLRPGDVVFVDRQSRKPEIVQREGVVIWRRDWMN